MANSPFSILLLSQLVLSSMLAPHPPSPAKEPWSMYLAIAYSESQSPTLVRAFNKTLANLTRTLLDTSSYPHNLTLNPLVITLPSSAHFSAAVLENACRAFQGKHVAAVLVIGRTSAAFGVVLSAETAGIPVLWARGSSGQEPEDFHPSDLGTLEVRVEPGAREMVQAVRALLLATHWHQFTVLADYSASSVLLHRDLAELFRTPPLVPIIHPLRSDAPHQAIFRLLADISRSTRGVVLLICDLYAAKRVSAEAKRLNMMDGHFVWLWIDTCPNNTPLLSNTTKESDAVDQTNNSPKTPINHEPVNSVKVSKNITDSIRKYKRDLLGNDTIVNVTSFQRISSIKHFENNNKRDRTKNPKDFLQSDSNTSLLLQQLNRGFVISGAEGGGRVLLSNTSRLSLRLKSSPRDVENSNAQRESKLEGKNSKYLFLSNSSGPPALDFEPVGATKGGGGRVAYLKDSRVNFDLSSFSRPDVRRDPDLEWSPQETSEETTMTDSLPVGLLAIRPRPMKIDRHTVKGAVRLLADTIKQVLTQCADWMPQPGEGNYETSCWINSSVAYRNFSKLFVRELRTLVSKVLGGLKSSDKSLIAVFDILNLVPEKNTDYDGPSYASEPTQSEENGPLALQHFMSNLLTL